MNGHGDDSCPVHYLNCEFVTYLYLRRHSHQVGRVGITNHVADGGTPGWTVLFEFEVEMAKENGYWRIVTCKHAQIMPHTSAWIQAAIGKRASEAAGIKDFGTLLMEQDEYLRRMAAGQLK